MVGRKVPLSPARKHGTSKYPDELEQGQPNLEAANTNKRPGAYLM